MLYAALGPSGGCCACCHMAEDVCICQWSKLYFASIRVAGLPLALLDHTKEAPFPCIPAIPATQHGTVTQGFGLVSAATIRDNNAFQLGDYGTKSANEHFKAANMQLQQSGGASAGMHSSQACASCKLCVQST